MIGPPRHRCAPSHPVRHRRARNHVVRKLRPRTRRRPLVNPDLPRRTSHRHRTHINLHPSVSHRVNRIHFVVLRNHKPAPPHRKHIVIHQRRRRRPAPPVKRNPRIPTRQPQLRRIEIPSRVPERIRPARSVKVLPHNPLTHNRHRRHPRSRHVILRPPLQRQHHRLRFLQHRIT